MKKTLLSLALLGSFAGTAAAADVTLYGIADLGLTYSYSDADDGTGSTNSFSMTSGNQSGSRFGLRGSEDLGNGLKVGFVLENGFSADTGTLGQGSRLFGRQATVSLSGDFGEVAFGRTGQLNSGLGTYGLTGNMSPFGSSFAGSVEISTYMVGATRVDNSITYKSPTFAGTTVYAQYSLNSNTREEYDEGKSATNRYGALGATYANGPFKAVLVADWYNWSTQAYADPDDGFSVTLGGSYDFEVVKAYLGVQYFDNMFQKSSGQSTSDTYATIGIADNAFKGYGVMVGLDAPVAGGTAMVAFGYADGEAAETLTTTTAQNEFTRIGGSVGYVYPFSKRTNVYAVGAYYQDKFTTVAGTETKPAEGQVTVGIRHRF
ncbi:porin [Sutterella sp.]|uniref:porin n=1 Tax=Sutterella sp. TaxID=1981025 RepID=UPI0026DF0349|nr:porin [Sutterella sp.]MDO5531613.1 porin [Sutterella sp.]